MKQKIVLTDIELRARWHREQPTVQYIEEGTILTPAAKDFLREHNIELRYSTGGSAPLDPPTLVAPISGPSEGSYAEAPAVPAYRPSYTRPQSPFQPASPVSQLKQDDPQPAGSGSRQNMTVTPIPQEHGSKKYQILATGEETDVKPEEMTHLRGNLLVPKTHPQICFRGRLDSLMADILCLQCMADEQNKHALTEDLGDLLKFTRLILGAEVKDEPLGEFHLLGLDSDGLREASHNPKKVFGINHPIPDHSMGRICMELNRLRTRVRETELAAANAFATGEGFSRVDIIEGLNRMSSGVYIVFLRELSGYYDSNKGNTQ